MLEAHEITHYHDGDSCLQLVATFEERQKSRYRGVTSCGKEIGWFIERGYVLSNKDVLRCTDGTLVKIVCADEAVSNVTSDEPLLLLKAAYHLGNRHVPLQVELDFLRLQQDHVLDAMVKGLGLNVVHTHAPFQPESGAYGGHVHHHD